VSFNWLSVKTIAHIHKTQEQQIWLGLFHQSHLLQLLIGYVQLLSKVEDVQNHYGN
jgi:hypothetical protein